MHGWGQGYFRINAEGHVTVHPTGQAGSGLDLYRIARDLNAQGMQLPLLIRFSDILKSRIHLLAAEFARAIELIDRFHAFGDRAQAEVDLST